jgi:MSHA biogenesis protein MshQ
VFNEVQIPNGNITYLELRVLNPTVLAATGNFSNWFIDVYRTSTGNLVNTSNLGSLFRSPVQSPAGTNSCGQSSPWIQIPNSSIGNTIVRGDNLNYVLYETSTGSPQIVDVLRAGNQSNLYTPGTSFETCGAIDATFTSRFGFAWGGGNSIKDWYRTPDGTGVWTGIVTANNANSVCGDNNASTAAQIGLTKTTSTTTVNTNTNFSFTLFAQNPLTGTNASNVVVTDNLTTAGLTFVSCTATAPDTCTNSGNTVTFTVSSLPANSSRSAVLTVFSATTGTKTNTITANTTGTPTASVSVIVSNSAPSVTTLAATTVASTSAVLNGSVNPNGTATAVSLGYSAFTGSYASTCTPATSSFSGSTVQNFSCTVSGLSCGTTYYFIATGTNSAGTSNGSELNFTTPSCGASFDAYETSFTTADAIAGTARIKTHVASDTNLCVSGGACNLTIGTFNSAKTAVQTAFTGPARIEIVDASSGSCASFALIATVSSSLTLSATGETAVTLPAVGNVYPNARVRIRFPASGAATSQNCSSDNFAIRPSSFTGVSVQDATSSTAGSTRSLTNKVLSTTTPVHKTGRPFSVNARATNASGTTTTNYGGTPSSVLAQCGGGNAACIASPGILTLGSGFSSGVLASTTASYNDVGSFSLVLQDTSFAAVDAGDSTTIERHISSLALDVGRFVPDHFATAVVTEGCSAFTYSGQPVTLFRVTAKDASGNTLTKYAASGVAQAVTLSELNSVAGSFATTAIAASTFTAGVSSTSPTYTFTNKATVPATIKLRATDVDSVSSSTGIDGTAATATEGSSAIRSGRIRLQNAYGSELLALPVPATIEVYNSSGWVVGTDTCTALTASNFALSFPVDTKNSLAACETALAITGVNPSPNLRLSAPGTGNGGWVNLTLNLGNSAVGQKCTAVGGAGGAETPVSLDWLKFDWTGSGSPTNPTARATFGVYKSPLIYRRENY